jgi:transposase-like protein
MGKISRISSVGPEEKPEDALTKILRNGCRKILQDALEVEISEFIEQYREVRTQQGQQRIVRNGYHRERAVQTGIGAVPACVPRARDQGDGSTPIRYTSKLLPPYLRRTRSIEDLLPWLYLKGVSSGDFSEALTSLLGENAPGLSATTIGRLKRSWGREYEHWSRRSLAGMQYVYVWADGVYFQARMDTSKQCLLVLMGSTPSGEKELIAILDGYRESEQSWYELLVGLKERGLDLPPKLAVGDGALGFWKALAKVFPETRVQRCWVHKMVNVLNKLPKSQQAKAKAALQEIWMAAGRAAAKKALAAFVSVYGAKYPKAVACLVKDEEELLAFYDFPADHWKHIRTTNPIESTFATVRLRTAKTRGCLSRGTALTMVFQLCRCAQKRWRKLGGYELLGKVINGIVFVDGVEDIAA